MPYVSEPTLSDGECRAAISDSFPTLAEQKSVLVSENGLWIETLTFLCEKTAEVWNAYLGKFDESLLLPELKKMCELRVCSAMTEQTLFCMRKSWLQIRFLP